MKLNCSGLVFYEFKNRKSLKETATQFFYLVFGFGIIALHQQIFILCEFINKNISFEYSFKAIEEALCCLIDPLKIFRSIAI